MVFHGFNVVVKVPPFLPLRDHFDARMSLTDQEIANMHDWGVNVVRLGVIWEAVETAPGVWNYEFLDEVESLIAKFAEHGIYTIIDTHQDMFSRTLCGEGIPEFHFPDWDTLDHSCNNITAFVFWLCGRECIPFKEYGIPEDEKGLPVRKECAKENFLKMHAAPEVASAFEQLWTNRYGL